MKIGIYNRWLATMGGGERHMLAIAQALQHQHQVEVITHRPVERQLLESRLHLNLQRVSIRVVPLMTVDELSALTAEYDLFINASHMSLFPARAARNVMMVYFPTPISLSLWGKFKRIVGLWLRKTLDVPEYVGGFYDPERTPQGILRRVGTRGYVNLRKANVLRTLTVKIGLPAGVSEAQVRCWVDDQLAATWNVSSSMPWQDFSLSCSGSSYMFETRVHAGSFNPSGDWVEPTLWLNVRPHSRRYRWYEWVFEQRFPELGLRLMAIPELPLERYLDTYDAFWANSRFTQSWIWRYWRRTSQVLYPPVDVESFLPLEKRNLILSVGRFFAGSHNKKHLALVRAFKSMVDDGLSGWELHLAGNTTEGEAHRQYLAQVYEEARGYPIHIHTNIPFPDLVKLYGESKIYWHASGYGENINKNPILFEHFGITTVEAMAAGCVPVVIGQAGQLEVVHHGQQGYLWQTLDELKKWTLKLIQDESLWKRLSAAAVAHSAQFNAQAFECRLGELLSALYSKRKSLDIDKIPIES